MTVSVTITKSFRVDSTTIAESRALSARATERRSEPLPAAKTGQLTTRTDNTTGTLTMAAGHGIVTANRVALFWTLNGVSGIRRNVLVGTVATNSVPFSGGLGDNLPANMTNVTVMVETVLEMRFDGDDVQALFVGCPGPVSVWFSDDANTEQGAVKLPYAGQAYEWNVQNGVTNPLAGVTTTRAHVAHGDSTGTRTIDVVAAFN
jgi:hypothetical protein